MNGSVMEKINSILQLSLILLVNCVEAMWKRNLTKGSYLK